jgi:hypothetical protein
MLHADIENMREPGDEASDNYIGMLSSYLSFIVVISTYVYSDEEFGLGRLKVETSALLLSGPCTYIYIIIRTSIEL